MITSGREHTVSSDTGAWRPNDMRYLIDVTINSSKVDTNTMDLSRFIKGLSNIAFKEMRCGQYYTTVSRSQTEQEYNIYWVKTLAEDLGNIPVRIDNITISGADTNYTSSLSDNF